MAQFGGSAMETIEVRVGRLSGRCSLLTAQSSAPFPRCAINSAGATLGSSKELSGNGRSAPFPTACLVDQGLFCELCSRRRLMSFFINSTSLESGWTFRNTSNSSAASLYLLS